MENADKVMITAAKAAGEIHRKYFDKGITSKTKETSFDLVTQADIEAEKAVVAIIAENFPQHDILGEEGGYIDKKSPYLWIIDPLDGTNNFASGLPIFSVSIALAYNCEVIMGAVYDVIRDEMFFASKDNGAYLNDRRIKVSGTGALEESILITGFYYDRGKRMIETLEQIKQFFFVPVRGIRRLGSAALDLCYVACGRAAGFWEFELSPWDYAAGKILVEEAGGIFTSRSGTPVNIKEKSFIVASNGKIHGNMINVLAPFKYSNI